MINSLLINKQALFFLISAFIISFLRFFTMPFLAIFLRKTTTISLAKIGLIIGLPAISQLIMGLILVGLFKRISEKTGLMVAFITPAIGMLGYVFFKSFYPLALSAIICGVGWSFYNPIMTAKISQYHTEENHLLNVNYWLNNLGGVIGPLSGAIIPISYFNFTFLVFSSLLAFIGVLIFIFYSDDVPVTDEEGISRLNRKIFPRFLFGIVILYFSLFLIESQYESIFGIVLTDRSHFGSYLLSIMLAVMTGTIIVIQPLQTKFLHLSIHLSVGLGMAFYYIGLIIFFSQTTLITVVLSAIFLALGESLIVPDLLSLINSNISARYQKSAFSLITVSGNLGYFIGPVSCGFIYRKFNSLAYLLFLLACLTFSTLLFFVASKIQSRKTKVKGDNKSETLNIK